MDTNATQPTPPQPMQRHGGWAVGLVLIAVGAVLLIGNFTTLGGDAVVVAVGVIFLVAYAFQRLYGLLVPGGILTGLGAGILVQGNSGDGGAVVLGLGLGFLSIYAIDSVTTAVRARWWPVIPGGILTVVGAATLAGSSEALAQVGRFWPVLLVLGGIALLFARPRQHT